MSLIIILIRPIIFIRFGSLFTAKLVHFRLFQDEPGEKEHSIQPSKTLDIYGFKNQDLSVIHNF